MSLTVFRKSFVRNVHVCERTLQLLLRELGMNSNRLKWGLNRLGLLSKLHLVGTAVEVEISERGAAGHFKVFRIHLRRMGRKVKQI